MDPAELLEPVAGDYPNHLAAPGPQRQPLAISWRLVVGLLLVCLLPRALATLRIPSVTPDGVYYIDLAHALERGDLAAGFRGGTVYPAILLAVHRMGFDWETAAKVWGVFVSTLVVLPLYGWVRRQFDDRVALVACFLYIVHPKFIEMSPEAIRDSTFWLLLVLALYWQWRAVVEVRLRWFALAGVVTAAACLTRFEGFYLFLPLLFWSGWRFGALRNGRGRLAAGVAISLAALPTLLLAANLLWVHTRGQWLLPRVEPGARALAWLQWLRHWLVAAGPTETTAVEPISTWRMLYVFFPIMTRGLSPCFALLMFGGLWKWRRTWARRDHQPLFVTAMVIVLSTWIQLWFDRQLCFRYALPIVLMASPFAALGLLGLTAWTASRVRRCLPARRLRGPGAISGDRGGVRASSGAHPATTAQGHLAVRGGLRWLGAVGPSAFVLAASATTAWLGLEQTFSLRKSEAALGVWLRGKYPAGPTLVGPSGMAAVAGYYARGRSWMYRRDTRDGDEVVRLVKRVRPDVVLVVATKNLGRNRCAALVERMRAWDWDPVQTPAALRGCGDLCVLLRRSPNGTVGRIANPSSVGRIANPSYKHPIAACPCARSSLPAPPQTTTSDSHSFRR